MATRRSDISESAVDFLELFYPVHYKIGIGIEDALRGGTLTRHQVAILMLVRSEGRGGRTMRRKDIELAMRRWFEISNSAISKAIRAIARPPDDLLLLRESPDSGRERQVHLTANGVRRVEAMVGRGRAFIQRMVDHLTEQEARRGVHFLTRVSSIIETVTPQEQVRRRTAAPRPRTRSKRS